MCAEHEARLSVLEKNDIAQDKRLEKHGDEIDQLAEMQVKTDMEIKLMNKELEIISGTTTRTEKKLDQLWKQRDDDHLRNPLENSIWTKRQILTVLIGLIVSFFFGLIITHLGL